MSDLLPASLNGTVTRFKGNGRRLGYPTANTAVPTELPDGVYFGYANLSEYRHHPAIIFIGVPTTLGDTDRRVEAHLLDINDRDYYDLPLLLEVHKFHRQNRTFPSVDDLVTVMKADEQAARHWFAGQAPD